MSSVYGDFRPMPNIYQGLAIPGGLGSGGYGAPESSFFSQPVALPDWAPAALQQAQAPGFNSGAFGMDNTREVANPSMFDNMLGPNGWGGMALGAAGGLASTFLGMKQYGLAKKTLAENKRQFQLNYDAQKQSINTRLEDRQSALVARNPGAYQSVGEYMDKNGIR